jgi:hypothetical protein
VWDAETIKTRSKIKYTTDTGAGKGVGANLLTDMEHGENVMHAQVKYSEPSYSLAIEVPRMPESVEKISNAKGISVTKLHSYL